MSQEKEYCTFKEIEIGEVFRAKDQEWVKSDDKTGSNKDGTIHYIYGGCTVEKINQRKPSEMNQQEIDNKARELVDGFKKHARYGADCNYCFKCEKNECQTELDSAKQCALIHVNGIINILPSIENAYEKDSTEYDEELADYALDYREGWQKVKESINKL